MKHRGFILILTLIFLQILSHLGVYSLMNSKLQLQWLKEKQQINTDLAEIKKLLNIVESKLIHEQVRCTMNLQSYSELLTQPISFWEKRACSGKLAQIRYYYVTEFLGRDPCAIVADSKRQNYIAAYYRVSILAILDNVRQYLLQSTLIKKDITTIACLKILHQVTIGRQMWRLVT